MEPFNPGRAAFHQEAARRGNAAVVSGQKISICLREPDAKFALASIQVGMAHRRTGFADAGVARSPGGTGTAAVMAVLAEMGVLQDDAPFVHESIVGTTFTGRVIGRCRVGEREAVVPSIEGSAWVTGEHAFHIDGDDPLRAGFRL